jgi:uroporphyrinogen decarboxylase
MNSRERVLAALDHREPDRPPRDLGSTTATGIHPAAYRALKVHLGLEPTWAFLSARAQLARVEPSVLERFQVDCLPLIPDEASKQPELDDQRTYTDRWGIQRRSPQDNGHCYVTHAPLARADRASDLYAYDWPDVCTSFDSLGKLAVHLRQTTTRALVLNLEVGFLHQVQFLRGFDQWLMDLAADPKLAETLMDTVLDIWLAEAAGTIKAAGDQADVVVYSDDIAFQDRPMVSVAMYRRLIKPRQKRVFGLLKSSGAKVFYHSCGNVQPLLSDLVEMGVDILNPVQVSARDMADTAALKREWDRHLVFWGGIDTQAVLPRGKRSDIYREVHWRLDSMAEGGGYVLAAVHNIQPEVPPQNVYAMFEAADEWQEHA